MECKICNKKCKNFLSLCRHLTHGHNINILEYQQKYEDYNIPKCKCGKDCKHKAGIKFYKSCLSPECSSNIRRSCMSIDARKNASDRLKLLRKTGVGNITHKKSPPCEKLKEYLIANNISFVEEFMPIDDRLFRIDIAFPDKKIGIEINGNQHYNPDGTLKKYYQDRHDLIEAAGWKIYEYHFSIVYSSDFNNLINILKNNNSLGNFDYSFYIKKRNVYQKKGSKYIKKDTIYLNRTDYFDTIKINWKLEQQKYIPLILESNINFCKFGWVGQVAMILNKKHQHVHKWMIAIMPEFYETCFKRNSKL